MARSSIKLLNDTLDCGSIRTLYTLIRMTFNEVCVQSIILISNKVKQDLKLHTS